jgi:hypothetical protein
MSRQIARLPGPSRRAWAYLALAVVAAAAALFSYSGAVMAGSFAISNFGAAAHWRMVGRAYAGSFLVALVGCLSATIAFVRVLRRERRDVEERAV